MESASRRIIRCGPPIARLALATRLDCVRAAGTHRDTQATSVGRIHLRASVHIARQIDARRKRCEGVGVRADHAALRRKSERSSMGPASNGAERLGGRH